MKIRKIAATMIAALTIGAASVSAVTPAFANDGMEVSTSTYYVHVNDFLSLRANASANSAEFERLGNGTMVQVLRWEGHWAYVYVPSLYSYGYVSGNYISAAPGTASAGFVYTFTDGTTAAGKTMTVCNLKSGALAVRSACCFDDNNIKDFLNNGEKVQFQYWGDNGYAYVYAPSLGIYGYVNAAYIA